VVISLWGIATGMVLWIGVLSRFIRRGRPCGLCRRQAKTCGPSLEELVAQPAAALACILQQAGPTCRSSLRTEGPQFQLVGGWVVLATLVPSIPNDDAIRRQAAALGLLLSPLGSSKCFGIC